MFNVECQISNKEVAVHFRWFRSPYVCICCSTPNSAFITTRSELRMSVLKNYQVTYKNYNLKPIKNFNMNSLITEKYLKHLGTVIFSFHPTRWRDEQQRCISLLWLPKNFFGNHTAKSTQFLPLRKQIPQLVPDIS